MTSMTRGGGGSRQDGVREPGDASRARASARRTRLVGAVILLACLLVPGACRSAGRGTPAAVSGRPRVVATTTMIGDVVRQIGGQVIDLTVLLPVGTDPHSFVPTSRSIAAVAGADLVFINGLGLEASMAAVMTNARPGALVTVSEGIEPQHMGSMVDPHVWMDPVDVKDWASTIAAALARADATHASVYMAAAQAYIQQLESLDAWIREQVATIPADRRILISDHEELGYFAHRYGFQLAGSVLPGVSTLSEASAASMAQLEDEIRQLGLTAIFVDWAAPVAVSRQVSADTGARIVRLYLGSLGKPGGEAGTYVDMMRYDVSAIVEALSTPRSTATP